MSTSSPHRFERTATPPAEKPNRRIFEFALKFYEVYGKLLILALCARRNYQTGSARIMRLQDSSRTTSSTIIWHLLKSRLQLPPHASADVPQWKRKTPIGVRASEATQNCRCSTHTQFIFSDLTGPLIHKAAYSSRELNSFCLKGPFRQTLTAP